MDETKCIVCGCTDRFGCDAGCSWLSTGSDLVPPLCDQCAAQYLVAKLWAVVFTLEGSARGAVAREVRELRTLFRRYISDEIGERFAIPTLRQVCEINRKTARWKSRTSKKGEAARA